MEKQRLRRAISEHSSPSHPPSVPFFPTDYDRSNSENKKILELFEKLASLNPMKKPGPMSGPCREQTHQMQHFLKENFGFRNTPNHQIVPGVMAFRIEKPVSSLQSNQPIFFPPQYSSKYFIMTPLEILQWQQSFRVYYDALVKGINNEFLHRALQGQSVDGEEAFRMKFVVRISISPIFMNFDGEIIERKLHDMRANQIRLVSVTGIDFAGRKHDYGDILYYIKNWRKVFEWDRQKNVPTALNGRDFVRCRGAQPVELHNHRILQDLVRMTRLRLEACDREGVEIVVETGIGLGVFAGKQWGIETLVRRLSAQATRYVLEKYGREYTNIRAVVFALPIFARYDPTDVYHVFVHEFQNRIYRGSIPVLIIDQDMHRLTVAIAESDYKVSQLNPADSHGVFGEYWQNYGPAVEEKLALTTAGLLVQHHFINPHVLNPQRYIPRYLRDTMPLDWADTVRRDMEPRSGPVKPAAPVVMPPSFFQPKF